MPPPNIPPNPARPARIVAACLHPYRLPLRRPWVAAATTLSERHGMLLGIATADGTTGWGDCAPLPSSGAAGHARVFAALTALRARLPGSDCDEMLAAVPGLAEAELRWALETALLDIAAQQQEIPLAGLLGAAPLSPVPPVALNAALGALDAGCAARAAAALAEGYAFAKIKVGVAPPDTEIDRLREVAAHTAGRLRLRLDANRAWDAATARRFLTAVADLPIDGVEEPLAAPTLDGLAQLQTAVPFALAVDESLAQLGVAALLDTGAVRRLVVKPARLGGLRATLALAGRAQAAGLEMVLTSVVDSAIGVTAAAHLAAALPGGAAGGLAHGLATSAWLAADVAPPPRVQNGRLLLGDAAGLGCRPYGLTAGGLTAGDLTAGDVTADDVTAAGTVAADSAAEDAAARRRKA